MQIKKCPKCGNEEEVGAKYCSKCGEELKENSIVTIKVKPNNSNKKIIIITIVSLLFFYLALIAFFVLIFLLAGEDEYIGSWGNHIVVTENGEIIKNYRVNIDIDYEEYKIEYYDFLNTDNSEVIRGEYTVLDNDKIKLDLSSGSKVKVYVDEEKLCFNEEDCEEYLIKDNINSTKKMVIEKNTYDYNDDYDYNYDNNDNFPNDYYEYDNDNDDIYDWVRETKRPRYVITLLNDGSVEENRNYYYVLERLEEESDDSLLEFELYNFDINKIKKIYKDKIYDTLKITDNITFPTAYITYNGNILNNIIGINDYNILKNFIETNITR